MKKTYATIQIEIINGEVDASVEGNTVDIIEGLAHMLVESNEMLRFFKAAIEVAELHNKQLAEKINP